MLDSFLRNSSQSPNCHRRVVQKRRRRRHGSRGCRKPEACAGHKDERILLQGNGPHRRHQVMNLMGLEPTVG